MGHLHSSSVLPPTSFRAKVSNSLVRNKTLQWGIAVLIVLLIVFYVGFSLLSVSTLRYQILKNTKTFLSETNAYGVSSYSVDETGKTSIETIDGLSYDKDSVNFVFIDSDVIADGTAYYIPADDTLVSSISLDFAWNFLYGTRFVYVGLFSVMFMLFNVYMQNKGSEVLGTRQMKIISWVCIGLVLAYACVVLACLG